MSNELLENLNQLHSTELGIQRIRKNLALDAGDVVAWCREKIEHASEIVRKGKNWYAYTGDIRFTINAHSFTIITAHKGKEPEPLPQTQSAGGFTQEELREALRAIDSTIRKCEKSLPKLRTGTSQSTLLTRRIRALHISAELIRRELNS